MSTPHWVTGFVAVIALCVSACGGSSAAPSTHSLAGRWLGVFSGRTPCVGVWDHVVLTLSDSSAGELVTGDGLHFPAAQSIDNGVRRVDVTLPAGQGECGTIQLIVNADSPAESAAPAAFSGSALGRCCGTVSASFSFVKAAP